MATYDALGVRFSIDVDGPLELDAFGDLRAPDGPVEHEFMIHVAAPTGMSELRDRGRLVGSGEPRLLFQLLVRRVEQTIAARADGPVLRAAGVDGGWGSIVLAGGRLTGKSTLAARLVRRGYRLVAEERTAFAADGRIRPYHRPIGLPEHSFGLLGLDLPTWAGPPCGCGGHVMMPPAMLGGSTGAGGPVRVVALVDHHREGVEAMSAAATIAALIQGDLLTLVDAPTDLHLLASVLEGAQCVRLGTADAEVARSALQALEAVPPSHQSRVVVEPRGSFVDVYVGGEAVIVSVGTAHHLNATAAATWLLHTDGVDGDHIAAELGLDVELVDETVRTISSF